MKSPLYWTISFYEAALTLSLGKRYDKIFSDVALHIPSGSSVLDLCCGTARLYRRYLKNKAVLYKGIEFNSGFASKLRQMGLAVTEGDVRLTNFPEADYIVMCSSFHLLYDDREMIFEKMINAARKAVIISEPVINFAQHPNRGLAYLARWFSNPGIGNFSFRYDLKQFREFCFLKNASNFFHQVGEPIALAVFHVNGSAVPPAPSGPL